MKGSEPNLYFFDDFKEQFLERYWSIVKGFEIFSQNCEGDVKWDQYSQDFSVINGNQSDIFMVFNRNFGEVLMETEPELQTAAMWFFPKSWPIRRVHKDEIRR